MSRKMIGYSSNSWLNIRSMGKENWDDYILESAASITPQPLYSPEIADACEQDRLRYEVKVTLYELKEHECT